MLLPSQLATMKLGVHRAYVPPVIPARVGASLIQAPAAISRVEAVPLISGQNTVLSDCVPTCCANAVQTALGCDGIFDSVVPNSDVISAYSAVTGYTPANPASDQGTIPEDMWAWWKANSIFGYQLDDAIAVDPSDEAAIRNAIDGSHGLAVVVALSIENQNQRVLMPVGTPGTWGRHCYWIDDCDGGLFNGTSWGERLSADWTFFQVPGFVQSAYALTLRAV